ncbi:PIN domain-containing protein [Micromonospora sp. NPDC047467]|uniref:PIN domain-containing protein n=1 Tax=Micromonospora sp. NPDC047467 TaxID=3154814 RepID=UPI0033CD56F0
MLDTNVLLDAYRFAAQARNELLDTLRKVGSRLWIPHQVALEFHKNRVPVIVEHDSAYRDSISLVTEFRDKLDTEFRIKLTELSGRVALPNSEADRLKTLALNGLDQAIKELQRMRQQHGVPQDALRNDLILADLQQILEGKVGEPPTAEADKDARAEADRRISEKRPPGFLDHKKDDPHGDYLLWSQALAEVKRRDIPLLIVTRDVKDDWFWKPSGRTLGARPELVDECRKEAGVPFVLMSTQTFLFHARKHLMISVSEDTLRQADALPPPSESKDELRLSSATLGIAMSKTEILFDHLNSRHVRLTHEIEHAMHRREQFKDMPELLSAIDAEIESIRQELARTEKMLIECIETVDALNDARARGSGAKVRVPLARVRNLLDSVKLLEGSA